MHKGLSIQIVWFDSEVIELRITASNGDFSGSIFCYVGIGALKEAAEKLAGFPRKPFDQQTLHFGTFERDYAGGGAELDFHCIDHSGHIQLRLRMETDCNEKIPAQTVLLHLQPEAAAIDTFIEELRAMEEDRDARAMLPSH